MRDVMSRSLDYSISSFFWSYVGVYVWTYTYSYESCDKKASLVGGGNSARKRWTGVLCSLLRAYI